jgi:hypothetical protein
LGLDAVTAVARSGHTDLAHLLDQSELGGSPDNPFRQAWGPHI